MPLFREVEQHKTKRDIRRDFEASKVNSEQPITVRHWLPATAADWCGGDDLRAELRLHLSALPIEPAVEMDPEDPKPVKVVSNNWIHSDLHGIMTPEIFSHDVRCAVQQLAKDLQVRYDVLCPVRIYKEALPAYGIGFFDFCGPPFPFDLRCVVQFGSWQFTTDTGEDVSSAGFKFYIATLVLPDDRDDDVLVGHDWGKMFDASNDVC